LNLDRAQLIPLHSIQKPETEIEILIMSQ